MECDVAVESGCEIPYARIVDEPDQRLYKWADCTMDTLLRAGRMVDCTCTAVAYSTGMRRLRWRQRCHSRVGFQCLRIECLEKQSVKCK